MNDKLKYKLYKLIRLLKNNDYNICLTQYFELYSLCIYSEL